MNEIPTSLKLGLRPKEFSAAVGSEALARAMVSAGWIKPVVQRKRLTLYDRSDVERCWRRIRAGETPMLTRS